IIGAALHLIHCPKNWDQHSHLVVTNHALLAIDAIGGVPTLPEYDAVVIDEAHELTSRVTQASTTELDPEGVERAGRRARHCVDGDEAADLIDSADDLAEALGRLEPGRIHNTDEQLVTALEAVRDRARSDRKSTRLNSSHVSISY